MTRRRAACDVEQLAAALGWKPTQVANARDTRLIPAPDVTRPAALGPRWSPRVVADLVRRRIALTSDLGVPNCGGWNAAGIISEHLGTPVSPEAVAELCRWGFIPAAGFYKGARTYAGWAVDRFDDRAALTQALISGRLYGSDQTATVLNVRRADVDTLVRIGWLRPFREFEGRRGVSVPLYRHGHLAALLAYDAIDWPAVRATPRGRRSPLARLTGPAPAALKDLDRAIWHHRLGHRYWAAGDTEAAVGSWCAAGDQGPAASHAADALTDPAPILRCAAWLALLPTEQADLAA